MSGSLLRPATARGIYERKVVAWWCLALVWMVAIGIVAYTLGEDAGKQQQQAQFWPGNESPSQCAAVEIGHRKMLLCVDQSGDHSWRN